MSTAERSTPPLDRSLPGVDEPISIPEGLVEAFLVTDPALARSLKADREASGLDRRDEMWDGIYVMSPAANIEHQFFGQELWFVFRQILLLAGGGSAYNVLNVSDRETGWLKNYREPDVAVYLATNPAKNCGTHMCGGPDLAVEILSPGDPARKKLDFYAKVQTRELLLLDRNPWALELYQLLDGRLVLVGTSTPDGAEVLTSSVLPLTFRLVPGHNRPTLEVGRTDGGPAWRI